MVFRTLSDHYGISSTAPELRNAYSLQLLCSSKKYCVRRKLILLVAHESACYVQLYQLPMLILPPLPSLSSCQEKDLGVTMNANLKVSEQCRIAASKGNQVLGMIRRNITYKEKSLIIRLYKAIVRPHLEYCIQAWSPYLRKDIYMLEKIQRRATKLIPGLRDLYMKND